VIVGSLGVLAALVMLWRSISTESAASPSQSRAPVVAGEPSPTPAPNIAAPTPGESPAATRYALPEIRRRKEEAPTESSGDRPSVSDGGDDATKAKPSPFGLTHMRAQVAAIEPKVNECLAQAQARGDKPTGDATLTFIAAKQGDKIIIESPGYDHEATTLKNEALVECLQGTSQAITFEGLPRDANGVFVTRTVKVENGALVENKLVKFSYMR
jgi:hypothetical protein